MRAVAWLLLVGVLLLAQPTIQAPTGLTVIVDGVSQLTTTFTLTSGNGILWACTSPTTGTLNCAAGINTAYAPNYNTVQHDFCQTSNGPTYTCKLSNKVLSGYQVGQHFFLLPDSDCTVACWLNIDSNGQIPIKLASGNDPGGDPLQPKAGKLSPVWYNGTVFVLF